MGKVYLKYALASARGVNRRTVLKGLAGLGVAPILSACGSSSSSNSNSNSSNQHAGPSTPDVSVDTEVSFLHGVASGDPYPDSVVLWTRVTPAENMTLPVSWEIAADEDMNEVLYSGLFNTDATRDFTVKVMVEKLEPQTHYWYRFRCGEAVSTVGRTKTAPKADAAMDKIKFAFSSCAWYSMGFFNAYRGIAEKDDLDVVFCLGDYIYEYGGDEPLSTPFALGRYMAPGHEIVSLEDYRVRHALYKTDEDLQAAHAAHPWICIWDDHETANNSYADGAGNHTEGEEGSWTERKRTALRAYFEWLPVREDINPNTHPNAPTYRRLQYGDLVEFFVLDTRLDGRTVQAEDAEQAEDPQRRMISDEQEQWLLNGMQGSTARWKVIAQQTMLSQLYITPGKPFGYDSWDGYVAQRNRLFEAFANIDNVIVITGDIHTAFCNELTADPSDANYSPGVTGSVGAEFVCPSITSQGLPPVFVDALRLINPHMRYAEGALETNHGYVIVTATPERCDAAWMYSVSVLTPIKLERPGPVWGINAGEKTLSRTQTALEGIIKLGSE